MSGSPSARHAVAEIRTGENPMAGARIGNRSIHQFWYLYAAYFRHVLLAPHRRPDSDQVTWSWSEAADARPATAPELADMRRRLTSANRAMADGMADLESAAEGPGGGAHGLEAQVRSNLQELINQLCAQSDQALGGFVCRTPTGLMLHSWGASTAAVPYYPDSQKGGINGTVWVDGQTTAGVTVVLQNRQGANVEQATSGRSGAFGFQNVAPGQYRVRVAGRDDFPAEGLAVTVGQEAVGGLELRGGSGAPVAARAGAGAGSPSGHKRRWLAGLALLVLLGAGGLLWRHFTPPAAGPAGGGKAPFAWQSASGKLVGSAGQDRTDDAGKGGGAGAWSPLSHTLSAPKPLKSPPSRNAKDDPLDERPPATSVPESAASSLRVAEEKSPPPDATADKTRLFRSDAKAPRAPDRAERAAAELRNSAAVPAGDAARDEPAAANPRLPESKTADPSPTVAARKRPTAAGSGSSSVEDPPDELTAPGRAQVTGAESVSTIPKGGSRSAQTSRPTGPGGGSGTANQSPVAAAAAGGGLPAQAASGGGGGSESTDHVPARPGTKARERAGGARTTTTVSTTLTTSPGEEAKETGDAAAAETGNDKPPANPPAARANPPPVRPAGPAGTVSRPPEKNPPENRPDGEAEPAPDAPAATKGPAKPVPPAGQTDRASAAPLPVSANPAQPEESPAAEPDAAPSKPAANPTARSSPPARKNRAAPAAGEAPSGNGMPAGGPESSSARPADDERRDARWVPLGRVSASAWQARLVRDFLLPTQPVPDGADDAMEAMQAALLRERKTQMPPTFHAQVTSSGLAFEIPAGRTGPVGPLRWRDAAGAEIAGSTVQGNRAELAWTGPNAPRGTDRILSDAAGREIVRVSLDQTGTPQVKARPGVRSWYWVGIEHAPADTAALLAGPAEPRLSWRLLSGNADASAWPQDNRWRDGRGQRIDLPLGPAGVGPGHYALALVDRVTGWAIACDITLR